MLIVSYDLTNSFNHVYFTISYEKTNLFNHIYQVLLGWVIISEYFFLQHFRQMSIVNFIFIRKLHKEIHML